MKYVWKNIGETPAQAISRYRTEHNIDKTVKMCFLGRLDPMAQGILPVLMGSEVKNMMEHLYNDKTYTVEAILGVSTDSYDPLGLITRYRSITDEDIELFIKSIESLEGTSFDQEYPPYSSFAIKGKPLWMWAQEGKILDKMPSKNVTVRKVTVGKITKQPISEYIKTIFKEIDSITSGDFRQSLIKKCWSDFDAIREIVKIQLKFKVSGGTYVRSLINNVCSDIPAHAHLIIRVEYDIKNDSPNIV